MKLPTRQLIVFLSAVLVSIALPVAAHPLDISISVLNIDEKITTVEASIYLHPFEGAYLLSQNGIDTKKATDFFQHKDLFFQYIETNVGLKNNGKACTFQAKDMPIKDDIELVADGLQVDYRWICDQKLGSLEFSNTLFVKDFPLQTNRLEAYFLGQGTAVTPLYQSVLTTKVFTETFPVHYQVLREVGPDQDQDGLSDREEALYFTDPLRADTDDDGYTDKEEIDNGWYALDPVPSPGQTQRNLVAVETTTTTTATQPLPSQTATTSSSLTRPIVTSPFQNGYLKQALESIKNNLSQDDPWKKLLVFLPVLLLGILHAVSGGHGKTILIAYLFEKERTAWDALRFSASLASTDIVGILFIGFGFEFLALSGASYRFMGSLQLIGAALLFILSFFLLIKSLLRHFQPLKYIHEEHAHSHTFALGIIAALAPCTFGWALVLTIVALGQTAWMVPLILAFGLGTFLFLMLLSFLLLRFRDAALTRLPNLARISSLASSLLLFLIAGTILITTLN